MKKRILVGISGGIDSTVSALLLKQQNYDVVGVMMSVWDGEYIPNKKHACYGGNEAAEIEEAKEICKLIDIPLHIIDCSKKFKEITLANFIEEYKCGRTPNPCVLCNQKIKFGALLDSAKLSGIDFNKFATGHYASVSYDNIANRYQLLKAADTKKDQTYFLYRLSQEQLSQTIFPLGNFKKDEVRKIALSNGLPFNDKKESQDFYCGDYKELLNCREKEGPIIDSEGKILGQHKGIWNYTIGQRKGLKISDTRPLYVINLREEDNAVIVGYKEELLRKTFQVTDINWVSVNKLEKAEKLTVKIRSTHTGTLADVEPISDTSVTVNLDNADDAVTPGQSAVFHSGNIVIGGGIISF